MIGEKKDYMREFDIDPSLSVKVFAPASVANIACGYDIMGLALEKPGDDIVARFSSKPGISISNITGAKKKLPTDPLKNTAGVAAIQFLKHLKYGGPGISLEIRKKMPFGSGLGSSAASAVGGVMAVNELLKRPLSKPELLSFAVLGEQAADGAWHADNVAPSLLGGIIFIRDNASLDVHRVHCPAGLYVTVVYPHVEILTKDARSILSSQVSLSQHITQSGNLGGLILGLTNSDMDLIRRSLQDVIIEPQRAQLIPYFQEVKDAALDCGALGCSISGAGPSMFALCSNSLIAENVGAAMSKVFGDKKIKSQIYLSPVNLEGATKY